MPALKDETRQESAARIRAHTANSAPYPHRGVVKGNGLPRGWRRSGDGETVYRKRNGWLCVVRTAHSSEQGPFVAVGRRDQAQGQWFRWQGHRTLEDALAKADEVMG